MKVKSFRADAGYSLKELSERSGLSVSYINEIEKGKKYPKVDKILKLANSLDVPFDQLVSINLGPDLNPFKAILESSLLKKFPFRLFGIKREDVFDLVATHPRETGILARMLEELGRNYDMRVEHFFHTALRSYQILNDNYFEDLEKAARAFRKQMGWTLSHCPTYEELWAALEKVYDYKTYQPEENDPTTSGFRCVYIPRLNALFLADVLSPAQKAFFAARELGYKCLDLEERAYGSPSLEVGSFEQVFNNFRASYFAEALLLPEKKFVSDLHAIFRSNTWKPESFMNLFSIYQVTAETLFSRLAALMPRHLKARRIHFLKFTRERGDEHVRLTRHLNMSRVLIPHGLGLKEHFCRRWLSVSIINDYEDQEQSKPLVGVQLSHFIGYDSRFFCFSVSYPGTMRANDISSVTIGFQLNDDFVFKAFLLDTLFGVFILFGGQRYAMAFDAIVFSGMNEQAAPTAANVEHMLPFF